MTTLGFSLAATSSLVKGRQVASRSGRSGETRSMSQYYLQRRSAYNGLQVGSAARPFEKIAKRVAKHTVVATVEPIEAVTPALPIIVGSVALAVPFFVAAVLFSERIMRQRACPTCKGSGLVTTDSKYYKRCPT